MIDTNESDSDDVTTISPTDWIRFLPLTADDLFELREEFELIGAQNMATRVEIERRRAFKLDGSAPLVTGDELKGLGVSMTSAKQLRQQQGRTNRIEVIESIAVDLAESFDDEDEAIVMVETDDGEEHSIFDVVSGEANVDVTADVGPGVHGQ